MAAAADEVHSAAMKGFACPHRRLRILSLCLVLDLEGGALLLDAVWGDLDDALEPRLVSERRAEDV